MCPANVNVDPITYFRSRGSHPTTRHEGQEHMRNIVFSKYATRLAAIGLAGLFATGCATKGFVREGLNTQDTKITDISSQVEDQQRQLRQAGERIDTVASSAQQARQVGEQANVRANEAFELAKGKLLYSVVLSDVAGNFTLSSDKLGESARQKLDDLASSLKSQNSNVYLEIEGHTDASGDEGYNLSLGLRRAEAVRRYLSGRGIPLHRMSVISYGESKPVSDNSTRDGRAANRRVEVRVLS
jgi:outer membrane protein OmpA-like peptidoglycan-associated protein